MEVQHTHSASLPALRLQAPSASRPLLCFTPTGRSGRRRNLGVGEQPDVGGTWWDITEQLLGRWSHMLGPCVANSVHWEDIEKHRHIWKPQKNMDSFSHFSVETARDQLEVRVSEEWNWCHLKKTETVNHKIHFSGPSHNKGKGETPHHLEPCKRWDMIHLNKLSFFHPVFTSGSSSLVQGSFPHRPDRTVESSSAFLYGKYASRKLPCVCFKQGIQTAACGTRKKDGS